MANGRAVEPVADGEPAATVGDVVAGWAGADAHPDRSAAASNAASHSLSMHRFHRYAGATSIGPARAPAAEEGEACSTSRAGVVQYPGMRAALVYARNASEQRFEL